MIQLDQLDRSDARSPYLQIAAALREAIGAGRLRPGDRLPSESELTRFYGVARMTVRQAIQELKTEGLATAEHGRGVFVRPVPVVRRLASERFARRHREHGRAAFLVDADEAGYAAGVDGIRVHEAPATAEVAQRLRIADGEPVIVRERRYLADGEPVEIATSYVPAGFARGTAITEIDSGPGGIYARLEDAGHPLARFVEEVGARMPTPQERRSLRLGPGMPVLTVVRTAFDEQDVAVEVCDTVKSAAAYVLEYDFPAR
ncbi:GntR family transcriptional regulator [Pseudonocardia sp. CA-107938]|uniref:GntR family transcriptional regulator n=1 Tax=Pseudonocardia sp. CA-107938 TaxID=3240021 RepID=UPI003D8CE709